MKKRSTRPRRGCEARAAAAEVLEHLASEERKRTDDLPPLVDLALADAEVLGAVVTAVAETASSDEGGAALAARAAWVLRHVVEAEGALSASQRTRLVRDATRSEFWEVRSDLCHVLPRLALTPRQEAQAVVFFQSCLSDASRIVQAWGMDALCCLAERRPALLPVAEAGLVRGAESPYPAVRARARKIEARWKKRRPGE